jgi:hypothetical protein
MWVLGQAFDLTPGTGNNSRAYAINQRNVVVGELNGRPWRWSPERGGHIIDLGRTSRFAYLTSINLAGVAVGVNIPFSEDANASIAIRCLSNGCVELNTLHAQPRWDLRTATGINDSGVIVGQARWQGQPRGYLLRPLAPR